MIIETTRGPLDSAGLERRDGITYGGAWTEYYLDGKCVHRSVTIGLMPLPLLLSGAGSVGNVDPFERYGIQWEFR